jgi:thioredoxin 1
MARAEWSGEQPTRDEVDRAEGAVLLEFGASWCGHCQAIEPHVTRLLKHHPAVKHIKIEDGPGLPLGRSFRVKLWPTFVFLRDGRVVAQLARPAPQEVEAALDDLAPSRHAAPAGR